VPASAAEAVEPEAPATLCGGYDAKGKVTVLNTRLICYHYNVRNNGCRLGVIAFAHDRCYTNYQERWIESGEEERTRSAMA
jgi:hypothetical protein